MQNDLSSVKLLTAAGQCCPTLLPFNLMEIKKVSA